MSNHNTGQNTGGVSPRSLILLGAFAALALNRDLRRGLVVGTRDAARTAQDAYAETVRPAIGQTIHQTLDTLREEGPQWLEQAQGRAGTLAQLAAARAAQLREEAEEAAAQLQKDYDKQYAPKLRGLVSDLGDTAEERRRAAEKAAKVARKSGGALLSGLQSRAEDLLDDAGDRVADTRKDARKTLTTAQKVAARKGSALISEVQARAGEWIAHAEDALEEGRRDADRRLNRARRQAQKELRRAHRDWDADKLERAVSKKLAPLQKQLGRDLARLEKDAQQRQRALRGESSGGMGGGLALGGGAVTLLALGAGAVVLARVPAARKAVLDAVESVNPDAAKSLHSFSHKARELIGSAWLETIEEPKAAPAPAAPAAAQGTQAGTTGAAWGGSPAPDAPAAQGMANTSPAPKPGDAVQPGAPEVKAPNTDATTADEKPVTSSRTGSFVKDQGAAGQTGTQNSGTQNSGAGDQKKTN